MLTRILDSLLSLRFRSKLGLKPQRRRRFLQRVEQQVEDLGAAAVHLGFCDLDDEPGSLAGDLLTLAHRRGWTMRLDVTNKVCTIYSGGGNS